MRSREELSYWNLGLVREALLELVVGKEYCVLMVAILEVRHSRSG